MATTTSSNTVNVRQLESAIGKLEVKRARQEGAVRDTDAHIAALRQLLEQLQKAK